MPVIMLGLTGFGVLGAGEYGGELEVLVETTETLTGCPECGVVATPHGRRDHLVRDIPSADRPVLLVWRKRLWRCGEPLCAKKTWSETHPQVGPRAALTERARRWACEQVGRDGLTVEAVRHRLGVGWNTVMRAVRAYGTPLVEAGDRLQGVTGLGVDEHVWQHAGPARRTGFATGIVDLTPGRPPRVLEVVAGRTGKVYADWIAEREQAWRDQIVFAALDPFRGYATALHTELPSATRVLDAFHVVRLGNTVVEEVRRRVQQQTLHRRGHKNDPLYQVRRLLLRGRKHLTDKAIGRLDTALVAGDAMRLTS
ncbi:MAG: ISL3 family transposase [Actinomycetota bacterium]|nr:ISL3 family transposase [Actinomycetota bacterium]